MVSWNRTTTFLGTFILVGTLLCLNGMAGEPRMQAERSTSDFAADSRFSPDKLFTADGQLIDAIGADGTSRPNGIPDIQDLGGYSAVFVREWVSAEAQRDLSNAYLYSRPDVSGNLRIHIGADRVSTLGESHVEFELNQRIYRFEDRSPCDAGSGDDCRFRRGHRTSGDLKVRLGFESGGSLDSAVVSMWRIGTGSERGRFEEVAYLSEEGCLNGTDVCIELNSLAASGGAGRSRDQQIASRSRVEVSLNVGALLGFNPCLSNFQVISLINCW